MSGFYHWQDEEQLILHCHLQPKASKDEIVGIHNDRLKIKITAPPVDGKANAHLIKFLAKLFSVPRSQIVIIKGELGRQKTLRISHPGTIPKELPVKWQ